ncbi:MAG: class I SAM-dependent methyltransferase, partial [Methanobacteriota archaeon]
SAVPAGWERIGDVVVIRLPPSGRAHARTIGRIHGEVLGARTVVEDRSGVHGPMRTPDIRPLWGDRTETVHVEGGVRFMLDLARVMFSSGNVAERGRTADAVRAGDVVVDLFAGIGYFALPIAVRVPTATVHACEVNPVAFEYLLENVRLNRAGNVAARLGDCRDVAPRGVADTVVMGHFDAPRYLDVAFACLRDVGTLLVHSLAPAEDVPDVPLAQVRAAASHAGVVVEDANVRIVKSYAPGIHHVVVRARAGPRPKGISGREGVGRAVTS